MCSPQSLTRCAEAPAVHCPSAEQAAPSGDVGDQGQLPLPGDVLCVEEGSPRERGWRGTVWAVAREGERPTATIKVTLGCDRPGRGAVMSPNASDQCREAAEEAGGSSCVGGGAGVAGVVPGFMGSMLSRAALMPRHMRAPTGSSAVSGVASSSSVSEALIRRGSSSESESVSWSTMPGSSAVRRGSATGLDTAGASTGAMDGVRAGEV